MEKHRLLFLPFSLSACYSWQPTSPFTEQRRSRQNRKSITNDFCFVWMFLSFSGTRCSTIPMENSVHFSSYRKKADEREHVLMPLGRFLLSHENRHSFTGRFVRRRQVDRPVSHVSLNRYFADKVKKDSATLNEQSLGAVDRQWMLLIITCNSIASVSHVAIDRRPRKMKTIQYSPIGI